VQLSAPAVPERLGILRHEVQRRSLYCTDEVLSETASKCDGYDAYDLVIICNFSLIVFGQKMTIIPLVHHFFSID
jgi:peroxin-1